MGELDTEASRNVSLDRSSEVAETGGNSQGSSVGGHSTSQSRSKSREEGLVSTAGVYGSDGTADSRLTGGTLQAGLDGVDRENRNPHCDTGSTTSSNDSREGKFTGDVSIGVLGSESTLDILVRGEVGGRTRSVTGQGHGATPEHTAHTTLLVQLAHHIHATGVLGLLARGEGLLALDLQEDLDTLKGRGDKGHGDGGEETGGGDLSNRVLRGVVHHGNSRQIVHQGLSQVITL